MRRVWSGPDAAVRHHGSEITRHQAAGTFETSHRHDYTDLAAYSRETHSYARRAPLASARSAAACGSSTAQDAYAWPARPPPAARESAPLENEPAPWPVLSWHATHGGDPLERAAVDAARDRAERKAWIYEGKTLPVREARHGEDERRGPHPGGPISRCSLTRGARAPVAGEPQWTNRGTGSSYAWPTSKQRVDDSGWRQHPVRAGGAARAEWAGGRGYHGKNWGGYRDVRRPSAAELGPRTAADDLHAPPEWAPRPESAPAAKPKRAPGLVSTAEWNRRQRDKARSAMPGAPKAAAESGQVNAYLRPVQERRSSQMIVTTSAGSASQRPALRASQPPAWRTTETKHGRVRPDTAAARHYR